MKFTKKGSIIVSVKNGEKLTQFENRYISQFLVFSVSDTGIGKK